ncbi:unnamed protein product, partial [marine sediment metagenome]
MARIKSILINNYRSIKKLDFDFENSYNILIGPNGGGKSNLLEVINKCKNLDFDYPMDCNKEAFLESKDILIEFLLQLSPKETEKIFSFFKISPRARKFIKLNEIKKTFKISSKDENSKEKAITTKWSIEIPTLENSLGKIRKEIRVRKRPLEEETMEGLKELVEAKKKVSDDLEETLDSFFPKIIYWTPIEKHIIKNPIDLSEFKEDFNISIPLKNMFYLAGFTEESLHSNINRLLD